MKKKKRPFLALVLTAAILASLCAAPAGAEGWPSVVVEGSTVYANGIPITILKGEDGKVRLYEDGAGDGEGLVLDSLSTVYGGGKNIDVQSTHVTIGEGVPVSTVYGGGYSDGTRSANVADDTYVGITNAHSPNIYGGGYAKGDKGAAQADVGGNTWLEIISTAPDVLEGQEGASPWGGGRAEAGTSSAQANVDGMATVNYSGFVKVVHGGGYAKSGEGNTAAANCGPISILTDGGNTRELYSGGKAEGAKAAANAESVTVTAGNSAVFAGECQGGGTASEGGTAQTGPVSLLLTESELQGHLHGGGAASGGGNADVGDVTITLTNCTVPAYEQLGRPVAAWIYGGGSASGAGSSATAGTVVMTVNGGESAGVYIAGGDPEKGGDASTRTAELEFGALEGYPFGDDVALAGIYSRVVDYEILPFEDGTATLTLSADMSVEEIGVMDVLDLAGFGLYMTGVPDAAVYMDSSEEKTGQFYYKGTPMFVARNGDILYGSFSDAMSGAAPGDTIQLFPGSFSTRLKIDRSVTIQGAAEHGTVLTGGIEFTEEIADHSPEGINVTIDGIVFEGKGIDITAWGKTPGLPDAKSVCIQNNEFRKIDGTGNHYAIHINNGDEALRNLTVRDNTFDGSGTKNTDAAGGIYATVCGTVTITGNTFHDMAFNGLTLDGTDSKGNSAESIAITNNVFEGWGRFTNADGRSGRAMRLSNFTVAAGINGNKFVCENPPEEYIKLTGSEPADVSGCYWDGKAPADDGVILGGFTSENYYLRPAMGPEDLSDYQAPPQGVAGGMGVISGVSAEMEYSADQGGSWTACTGTEVTGLAAGEYWVRVKAHDGFKPSGHVAVQVGGWSEAPSAQALISPAKVVLPYEGDVVLTAGQGAHYTYQWQVNRTGGADGWTDIGGAAAQTYTLPKSDVTAANNGTQYRCRITNSEPGLEPTQGMTGAVTLAVEKGVQAAPSGMTGGRGRIDGVSAAMEYSADNGGTWTACAGTSVTGLSAGEYLVRLSETEAYSASESVKAVVSPTGSSGTGDGGGGDGGSAAPGTPEQTVTNPDGSKTTTETGKDGTVKETTEKTDGSVVVVEKKTDGSTTETVKTADGVEAVRAEDAAGKVTAAVTVPENKAGTVVELPVAELPVTKEAEKAPEVTVKTEKPVTVAVPLEAPGAGVVAVIVHPDGTEEVVRKSVSVDGELRVPLEEGATLRVMDRSVEFQDAGEAAWAGDAIAFVSSHELIQGTGDGNFSPSLPMDRGMLVTVLHRLENEAQASGGAPFADVPEDAYYAPAAAWAAEKGIVMGTETGFSAEAEVTREQLAAILYRYLGAAGKTDARSDISAFQDSGEVSDWAREAMSFAVGAGLITGRGDGVLDPKGTATRAEAAVILSRLVAYLAQ